MKKIYVDEIIRRKIYEEAEQYSKENNVGLAHMYLIITPDVKEFLDIDDSNLFYGIKIAVDNTLDFGSVIMVSWYWHF